MLKTLFLLLLLAFGAAMFAAGVLAPPSVKAPLEALAARARAWLPAANATIAALPKPGASTSAPSAHAADAASTSIASLLVPVPPPPTAHYALQAATFASHDAAATFAAAALRLDYKATVIPISDAGQPFIVAIGDYPSADAAHADQFVVQRQLQGDILPPVILLPTPPAAASAPTLPAAQPATSTAAAPVQNTP